jgi:hypothetical protein
LAFSLLIPFDNPQNYVFPVDKIGVTDGRTKLVPQVSGDDVYIHCKLDENQGLVAIDSSGNGRHGAFQGGLDETAWTTGKINYAIQGNGSGFINFDGYGDFERTDDFSFVCWFKFTALVSTEFIIAKQKSISPFIGYSLNTINGKIRLVLRDDLGNLILLESSLTYNDGDWHLFVATWKHIDDGGGGSLPSGAKLYVDNSEVGVLITGNTLTGTIRIPTINLQISGRDGLNNQLLSTSVVDEVEIYSRELTPADVDFLWNGGDGTQEIPGATTTYPTDNPTIRPNAGVIATEITGFVATINVSGSDEVRWVMTVDSVDKWWNGISWVDSTDYSETNTIAEIAANIGTLLISNAAISYMTYLHSDDGSTTPQLLDVTISYNIAADVETQFCTVYGTNIDTEGNPDSTPFIIQLSQDAVRYFANITRITKITITPDENTGYWEIPLLETESMDESIYYEFIFTKSIDDFPKDTLIKKDIPNVAYKNFWELPDA